MKRHSLSFRHMLYLSLHSIGQNLLRTFVTVLLLTVCASAFGCASSTFLDYSKTQSQLFLSSEDSVFSIAKFDWSNNVKEEGSLFEYVSVAGPQTRDTAVWLSEEEIAEIESLTSIGYARVYDRSGERDVSFGIFDKSPVLHCWYYADYDRAVYEGGMHGYMIGSVLVPGSSVIAGDTLGNGSYSATVPTSYAEVMQLKTELTYKRWLYPLLGVRECLVCFLPFVVDADLLETGFRELFFDSFGCMELHACCAAGPCRDCRVAGFAANQEVASGLEHAVDFGEGSL